MHNNLKDVSMRLGMLFSKDKLNEQTEKYAALKITKSARGQCVLFFGILNIVTLLLTYFLEDLAGITFTNALLGTVVLYLPVLFFVYKGNRLAIVILMLIWIGDKLYTMSYQLNAGNSIVPGMFFLIIGVGMCMKALQVENARRKPVVSSVS